MYYFKIERVIERAEDFLSEIVDGFAFGVVGTGMFSIGRIMRKRKVG